MLNMETKFKKNYDLACYINTATFMAKSTHKSYGYKMGVIKYKNGKLNPCIIKLEIPKEALRTEYATSTLNKFGKHRCSKARVLGFYSYYTGKKIKINEARSSFDSKFIYKLGETIYPDSFNMDFDMHDEIGWPVCAEGIHYFTNMKCAGFYADIWTCYNIGSSALRMNYKY